ncbi:hypothetical protein HY385_01945 [Candidatus Daviesbacteria bacterium]|nr:hypothetical protein [Candidatus Daviesbacteria bacterium]
MEDQVEGINPTSEIRQLFEGDQQDRQNFSKDPTKGLEIRQKDEQRLEEAKEILAKGEILDPEELNMLAFIFQHGDTVKDYQQALELATEAVELGLPPQNSLIPQATDRLMVREQLDKGVPLNQLKQKFGTQVMFDSDGTPVKPQLDGTVTKEELKKFGIEV